MFEFDPWRIAFFFVVILQTFFLVLLHVNFAWEEFSGAFVVVEFSRPVSGLETHFWKSRLGLASDLNFKSRSRVLVSKNYGLEIWEVSRLKILARRRSKILNLII